MGNSAIRSSSTARASGCFSDAADAKPVAHGQRVNWSLRNPPRCHAHFDKNRPGHPRNAGHGCHRPRIWIFRGFRLGHREQFWQALSRIGTESIREKFSPTPRQLSSPPPPPATASSAPTQTTSPDSRRRYSRATQTIPAPSQSEGQNHPALSKRPVTYRGNRPSAVIPGPRSGTRNPVSLLKRRWIPAFAGMTATGTDRPAGANTWLSLPSPKPPDSNMICQR